MSSIKEDKAKVSSHGLSTASIFFLGGYPLNDDLACGLALSGFNESMINKFLKPNNISIRECYRSVLIKERLEYSGTNPKKQREALKKINITEYESILLDELKYVQPTVIVPLDDISLSSVFPHINQIRKPKGRKYWVNCYRGSILPLRTDWQTAIGPTIRVIPTLSPQILQQDWTAQSYTYIDYKRIIDNSLKRSKIEEYGLVWITKTAKELNGFFRRMIYEKGLRRCAVDIETWYGLLTCISFCFDGYEAVSVPLSGQEINSAEMALLWYAVAKLLASEEIEKEGQNFKYDWALLERWGFRIRNFVHDTNLKAGLIYPELPKGLDFLTSIYTPIPYYKDEGKAYNDRLYTRDKLYLYNGKDSLATRIVGTEQDKELEELNLNNLYYKELVPSVLIYKNMDETGILIDDEVKAKLNEKYRNHYEVELSVLRSRCNNDDFNPRSVQNVGELVYEILKFPKRTRVNDAGETVYKTDKDTLDDLLIHYGETNKLGRLGYSIVSEIILCKKLSMVIQYINTPLHPNNHWRGTSNLTGTETGRSSSNKTIDERWRYENEPRGNDNKLTKRLGRSLQTITKHGFSIDDEIFTGYEDRAVAKDLRMMFVPHHGYMFVECDGSQAEARVVAVLAEDYEMLEMFDQKPNIHKKTAGLVFSIDPNLITKEEPYVPKVGVSYYHIGKIARHAGNNNMKPGRLSSMSHLPLHETTRILDIFHNKMHIKIRAVFHKEIRDCINKDRLLVNPNGRRRTFFGRLDESLYNEAIGNIQQGTISDLTKFTQHRVVSDLDGYMSKYWFLNEAHDSILAEVKKGEEHNYAKTFKKHYERPINFLNCSLSRDFDLIIPCEVLFSETNWMDVKEVSL